MLCCARWSDGYAGISPHGWVFCNLTLGHEGPHIDYYGRNPTSDTVIETRDTWSSAEAWAKLKNENPGGALEYLPPPGK